MHRFGTKEAPRGKPRIIHLIIMCTGITIFGIILFFILYASPKNHIANTQDASVMSDDSIESRLVSETNRNTASNEKNDAQGNVEQNDTSLTPDNKSQSNNPMRPHITLPQDNSEADKRTPCIELLEKYYRTKSEMLQEKTLIDRQRQGIDATVERETERVKNTILDKGLVFNMETNSSLPPRLSTDIEEIRQHFYSQFPAIDESRYQEHRQNHANSINTFHASQCELALNIRINDIDN